MIDAASRHVLDAARGLLEELDIEVVLDRVLAAARELTGARYAALGVLNESGTGLARFITEGIDADTRAAIGQLPRGRGVLGELIVHPRPLRLEDVGGHPRSYGFPAGHPPMRTFVGVPILIEGRAYGNLYLTEKQGGGRFTEEDEQALMLLAEFAGVAVDHAQRYGGQQRRRDALERTVATLEATTEVSRAVGGQTDLAVVLELVAKRGRALVSARALVIELLDGPDQLVIASGAGEWPAQMQGERVPLADTVAETALRTLRTQPLEEALNRARFDQHGLGRLGVQADSGLAVPLVFHGRPYGVLVAIDRLDGTGGFGAEDARLLEAFASSAATAVATAQSVASERQRQRLAAAEEERGRWARELHDETLQRLAMLQVALSAARRSGRTQALQEAVDGATGQLQEEIGNLRSLISELRPPALDELGIEAALQGLSERSGTRGIEVDVSVSLSAGDGDRGTPRHAPQLETAVYRIVQESLTNAAKHGDAKRAVVEVGERAGAVHVSVRDDGHGFDPSGRADGFGLVGMRERAELLEGSLEVDTGPAGTTIRAVLPVAPTAQPQSPLGELRAGNG